MNIPRLSLLLTSLICSSFAYAGEGFYIGAGASYNWLDMEFRAREINTETGSVFDNHNADLEGDEAGGQVMIGYTWLISAENLYFISIEGFADFFSLDTEIDWTIPNPTSTRTLQATLENAYGAILKPGVFITNNINVFALAGYSFSKLKDIQFDSNLPVPDNVAEFDNQSLNGYRLGLGTQYLLTKNLTVELGWNITFYNENIKTNDIFNDGNLDEKLEFKSTETNQIFLNLQYYFR